MSISTKSLEMAMGGMWVIFGLWGWSFSWFTEYLTELHTYAGMEWVLILMFSVFGSFQMWAAWFNRFGARAVCSGIGSLYFLFLAITMIEARGIEGAHTAAFPYWSSIHVLLFAKNLRLC